MAFADEQLRARLETRSRKSVRHTHARESGWAQRPLSAGGLDVRGNTRFIDQTGQEIVGLSAPIGTMTTGPA